VCPTWAICSEEIQQRVLAQSYDQKSEVGFLKQALRDFDASIGVPLYETQFGALRGYHVRHRNDKCDF
jgi:hypothetical protein